MWSLLLTHHPSPNAIYIPARNFEIPLPGDTKKNGQNFISRLRRKNSDFSLRNTLTQFTLFYFICNIYNVE